MRNRAQFQRYADIEELYAKGNTPRSQPYTAATVTSGQTYAVKNTDIVVRMDTSGGTTATANLPAPAYIGEKHTFWWYDWSVGQVPPVVNTTGGKLLVPFTGMTTGGAAGLATTSVINTTGASYTLEWDGTEWVSI